MICHMQDTRIPVPRKSSGTPATTRCGVVHTSTSDRTQSWHRVTCEICLAARVEGEVDYQPPTYS
jgi:hypothetical protein